MIRKHVDQLRYPNLSQLLRVPKDPTALAPNREEVTYTIDEEAEEDKDDREIDDDETEYQSYFEEHGQNGIQVESQDAALVFE